MATANIAEAIAAGETYIIAEIGQNHQGDLEHAKKLISIAAESGVNAVKSQKRHTRTLLTDEEYDRPYDSPNAFADTYGLHRDALELSVEQHTELKEHAESLGIAYFVSPWDPVSSTQMSDVGMPIFKIASASITDEETVRAACKSGKPVIISTGMSTEDQIEQCVNWLRDEEIEHRYILHCTSTYPSKFEELNLSYMNSLAEKYPDCDIGFSGHHKGIAMDIAATAMGAKIIERHFTLDRTQKGGDHAASLEPAGLAKLVRDVRAYESAIGDGIKKIYDGEKPMIAKLRRVK
ncbi:MAG: N-acetylneuraminate synthase family protein [Candidatus Thermoplasmatota archaeon]|nr:N-acetylneuraminate synthase family protein [Candidatus Thermoplasmatota archaeon]